MTKQTNDPNTANAPLILLMVCISLFLGVINASEVVGGPAGHRR